MQTDTKTRVQTGLVAGLVFCLILFFGGQPGIGVITAVISGFMLIELSRVFYSLPDRKEKTIALIGTSWLILFMIMLMGKVIAESLMIASMGMMTYFLFTAERNSKNLQAHFNELIMTVFMIVYVVISMVFLPLIRSNPSGLSWVFLFFCIVWANDTGAYFAGRRFGKNKLYPLISPRKTIEGSLGGLMAGLAVSLVFKITVFSGLGWFGCVFIPLIIGTASQVGDLVESFLKRAFNLKDSGEILPGHGGVLDRFDGILFSLPLMYFCVRLFG